MNVAFSPLLQIYKNPNSAKTFTKLQISMMEKLLLDLKSENDIYKSSLKKLSISSNEVLEANVKLQDGITDRRNHLQSLTTKLSERSITFLEHNFLRETAKKRLIKYHKYFSDKTGGIARDKIGEEIDSLRKKVEELKEQEEKFKKEKEDKDSILQNILSLGRLKIELENMNLRLNKEANKLLNTMNFEELDLNPTIENRISAIRVKMEKSEKVRKDLEKQNNEYDVLNGRVLKDNEFYQSLNDKLNETILIFDQLDQIFLNSKSDQNTSKISSNCSNLSSLLFDTDRVSNFTNMPNYHSDVPFASILDRDLQQRQQQQNRNENGDLIEQTKRENANSKNQKGKPIILRPEIAYAMNMNKNSNRSLSKNQKASSAVYVKSKSGNNENVNKIGPINSFHKQNINPILQLPPFPIDAFDSVNSKNQQKDVSLKKMINKNNNDYSDDSEELKNRKNDSESDLISLSSNSKEKTLALAENSDTISDNQDKSKSKFNQNNSYDSDSNDEIKKKSNLIKKSKEKQNEDKNGPESNKRQNLKDSKLKKNHVYNNSLNSESRNNQNNNINMKSSNLGIDDHSNQVSDVSDQKGKKRRRRKRKRSHSSLDNQSLQSSDVNKTKDDNSSLISDLGKNELNEKNRYSQSPKSKQQRSQSATRSKSKNPNLNDSINISKSQDDSIIDASNYSSYSEEDNKSKPKQNHSKNHNYRLNGSNNKNKRKNKNNSDLQSENSSDENTNNNKDNLENTSGTHDKNNFKNKSQTKNKNISKNSKLNNDYDNEYDDYDENDKIKIENKNPENKNPENKNKQNLISKPKSENENKTNDNKINSNKNDSKKSAKNPENSQQNDADADTDKEISSKPHRRRKRKHRNKSKDDDQINDNNDLENMNESSNAEDKNEKDKKYNNSKAQNKEQNKNLSLKKNHNKIPKSNLNDEDYDYEEQTKNPNKKRSLKSSTNPEESGNKNKQQQNDYDEYDNANDNIKNNAKPHKRRRHRNSNENENEELKSKDQNKNSIKTNDQNSNDYDEYDNANDSIKNNTKPHKRRRKRKSIKKENEELKSKDQNKNSSKANNQNLNDDYDYEDYRDLNENENDRNDINHRSLQNASKRNKKNKNSDENNKKSNSKSKSPKDTNHKRHRIIIDDDDNQIDANITNSDHNSHKNNPTSSKDNSKKHKEQQSPSSKSYKNQSNSSHEAKNSSKSDDSNLHHSKSRDSIFTHEVDDEDEDELSYSNSIKSNGLQSHEKSHSSDTENTESSFPLNNDEGNVFASSFSLQHRSQQAKPRPSQNIFRPQIGKKANKLATKRIKGDESEEDLETISFSNSPIRSTLNQKDKQDDKSENDIPLDRLMGQIRNKSSTALNLSKSQLSDQTNSVNQDDQMSTEASQNDGHKKSHSHHNKRNKNDETESESYNGGGFYKTEATTNIFINKDTMEEMDPFAGEVRTSPLPSQTKWAQDLLRATISRQLNLTRLQVAISEAQYQLSKINNEIMDLEDECLMRGFELRVKNHPNLRLVVPLMTLYVPPSASTKTASRKRSIPFQTRLTAKALMTDENEILKNNEFLAKESIIESEKMICNAHLPMLEKALEKVMRANDRMDASINQYEEKLGIVDDRNKGKNSKETRLRMRYERALNDARNKYTELDDRIANGFKELEDTKSLINDQRELHQKLKERIEIERKAAKPNVPKMTKSLNGYKAIEKWGNEKIRMMQLEEEYLDLRIAEKSNDLDIDKLEIRNSQFLVQIDELKDKFFASYNEFCKKNRMKSSKGRMIKKATSENEIEWLNKKIKQISADVEIQKSKKRRIIDEVKEAAEKLVLYKLNVPPNSQLDMTLYN